MVDRLASSEVSCGEWCVCKVDEAVASKHQHFVEVAHEAYHVQLGLTKYIRVYVAALPKGKCTLYHRHTRDTLYFCLESVKVRNDLFVQDAGEPSSVVHDARRGETFYRWHETNSCPLVHRVCHTLRNDDGDGAPAVFFGIEFLSFPPKRTVPDEWSGLERTGELDSKRARIWQVKESCEQLSFPFYGIKLDMVSPLDTNWDGGEAEWVREKFRPHFVIFSPSETLSHCKVGERIIELLPNLE